ncbi:MAG: hypothetical protein RBU37_07315 [Myxococcota bacterium]|nr:hypothetical protein [Myxococcota bacterium]
MKHGMWILLVAICCLGWESVASAQDAASALGLVVEQRESGQLDRAEDAWWQTEERESRLFVQVGPRFHSLGSSSAQGSAAGVSLAAGYWFAPSLAVDLQGAFSSAVTEAGSSANKHEQLRVGAGARMALPICLSPLLTARVLYERLDSDWRLGEQGSFSGSSHRDALVFDAGAGLSFGYGMLTGDLLFTAAFNLADSSVSSTELDPVARFDAPQLLAPGFFGMTSAGIEAHLGMRF